MNVKKNMCLSLVFAQVILSASGGERYAVAQSDIKKSANLAEWLNARGQEVWGESPEACSDLEFARRAFLDILGRVPSVSELRDFEALDLEGIQDGKGLEPVDFNRRTLLVDLLVFGNGHYSLSQLATDTSAAAGFIQGQTPISEPTVVNETDSPKPAIGDRSDYHRLYATQLARHWSNILAPGGGNAVQLSVLEDWLRDQFSQSVPYDRLMRPLVELDNSAGPPQYYQSVAVSPVEYAGTVARSMLGVRIECAQCHDHPFTDWKQEDFWGLAAFYSGAPQVTQPDPGSGESEIKRLSTISADGVEYSAKLLWSEELIEETPEVARQKLSSWLCSADNPYFASNAANRFWQYLVGRGLYADVENLDQATDEERQFMEALGRKFAGNDFDIRVLIAAICKSDWYMAKSSAAPDDRDAFYRPMKSISPDQIFDSLEQALLLPIGRVDGQSPRWSGAMAQLLSRLNEAASESPEEYVSGIPQALAIMNGSITANATSLDESRLLRAVLESPFFTASDKIEVFYLAVLSRRPSIGESDELTKLIRREDKNGRGKQVYGEVLWALINSPEFVLCR